MGDFTLEVKKRLKNYGEYNKVYLKANYRYEVFSRHGISDEEINLLFDPKKVLRFYPNSAFENRIDAEVWVSKEKTIKIIFQFDPIVSGFKNEGKVGIVTAFRI